MSGVRPSHQDATNRKEAMSMWHALRLFVSAFGKTVWKPTPRWYQDVFVFPQSTSSGWQLCVSVDSYLSIHIYLVFYNYILVIYYKLPVKSLE